MMVAVVWNVSLLVVLFSFGLSYAEESVDSFSEIDVNELGDGPVRFGLRFWDDETQRYKKLTKSLGSVLNTGVWPTLWEVCSSGPAPWNADDERMDMWVGAVYRNLYQKHQSMQNASYFFGNNSIDITGKFLGVPEAYALSIDQKTYRAEQAAEKEGKEADLSDIYYQHNGLDQARIDDLGKFYAASVDHLKGLGVPLPFVELFDEPGDPEGKDTYYVSPEQMTYLVKKTRDELDARNLFSDEVKILAPNTRKPHELTLYLKALAKDKEAYDKLYAISTYFADNGTLPLSVMEKAAVKLQKSMEKIFPSDWEKKPVAVTGLRYFGPTDDQLHGMYFFGDISRCYEDKHQRTGHKILKDTICQSPWFATRTLASIAVLLSNGLPWVVYNQAADPWWDRSCSGLLDKDNRPKQMLAALETLIPFFTNETYPIKKQWKNFDECFISAFKSGKKNERYIVAVTNYSPDVCERSFSLKGIDLWSIRKARIVTYNNGTIALDADKPYRALISRKLLTYDTYDEDDGTSVGPEIEFDLTVGPYASATAIIDTKASKGKRKKKKPKKEKQEAQGSEDSKEDVDDEEEEEEVEFDEDEEAADKESLTSTSGGDVSSEKDGTTTGDSELVKPNDTNNTNTVVDKVDAKGTEHSEL